jgi:hypothetical protein
VSNVITIAPIYTNKKEKYFDESVDDAIEVEKGVEIMEWFGTMLKNC